MAATVKQTASETNLKYNVQTDRSIPADIAYIVDDVADEDEAISAARAVVGSTIPSRVGFYALQSLQVTKRNGSRNFTVTAGYENAESGAFERTRPKPSYSFSTKGYSEHKNYAPLVAKYPDNAKDYGQAIDVGKDNQVNGIDVPAPAFSFTETHYFKPDEFTIEYQAILAGMTGRINQKPFRGYAPGRVRFEGAEGSRTGDDSSSYIAITFDFSVKENLRNETIDGITIEEKRGWDYMWVKVSDDATDSYIRPKIKGIYIHRVTHLGDFEKLGIGDT